MTKTELLRKTEEILNQYLELKSSIEDDDELMRDVGRDIDDQITNLREAVEVLGSAEDS